MERTVNGITVEHFFTTYEDKLKLELLTGGEGMHRIIREGALNRPALALTGFFKYFAHRRIQVLGAAEMAYLKTLEHARQVEVLTDIASRQIPCIVLSRNYVATPAMKEVSEQHQLPILRTTMITRHWINLATLCIDNEFAPSTSEHATMLDVKGIGVLLRGDSGVGKSECALALIERGHSLVADDLTHIKLVDERELIAFSPALNRGYMECRGIGIINIAEMFGIKNVRAEKRVDMVISLHNWTPEVVEERTGLEENHYTILDQRIAAVDLYVRPGRDIARLVEVAALVQALKIMGHDPAKEFNERLIEHMAAERAAKARPRVVPLQQEPDEEDTDDE